MKEDWLPQLQSLCLRFPESVEAGGVGDPTFKVRDKIFAMQHGVKGRPSMWCKAQQGVQSALVEAEPDRFFVPPYVGHNGWVGAWLDIEVEWDHIADLIETSYRMTAPKRLISQMDTP